MPFLLAEILDFQGSAHLIGVGSLSYLEKTGRAACGKKKKVSAGDHRFTFFPVPAGAVSRLAL